jgi:hypothetical protein
MNILIGLLKGPITRYMESNPEVMIDVLVGFANNFSRRRGGWKNPMLACLAAGASLTIRLYHAARDKKLEPQEKKNIKGELDQILKDIEKAFKQ